jgi:hypothetical protein
VGLNSLKSLNLSNVYANNNNNNNNNNKKKNNKKVKSKPLELYELASKNFQHKKVKITVKIAISDIIFPVNYSES